MYSKLYKYVLDEQERKNQQNPSFSKLHIEMIKHIGVINDININKI
jgi:hypothetical protein